MAAEYSVSFDEKHKIVMARVSGEATHEDHCAVREKALRLCTIKRCMRLLVDLRKVNTAAATIPQCFAFGEELARSSRGLRLAHVLPKGGKSAEDIRFTSTVESNRGVATAEFHSLKDARKWLLHSAEANDVSK